VECGPGKSTTKNATPSKSPLKNPTVCQNQQAGTRSKGQRGGRLDLIQRAKGATLSDVIEATGWQAHSAYSFISATMGNKIGLMVEFAKREGGTQTMAASFGE
jgi:hypothetical protein